MSDLQPTAPRAKRSLLHRQRNEAVRDEQGSKRAYTDLADYAKQQGVPVEAFIAVGWREVQHPDRKTGKLRRALEYPTLTGPRWRYIDGLEARHDSPNGYQPSWYGALDGEALVLVNGAAGVIAARHWDIPAIAVSDGEQRVLPDSMIAELVTAGVRSVIIAADSDQTGKTSAAKRARQLLNAGIDTRVVDLQLGTNGDIADFCKLHRENAAALLPTLPTIEPDKPKPIIKKREITTAPNGDTVDWDAERVYRWKTVILPTLEQHITHQRGKHFSCIFTELHSHGDKNPSARISTDKHPDGLYICHCGAHSWDAVAERLGLPDFMAWWRDERKPLLPVSTVQRKRAEQQLVTEAALAGAVEVELVERLHFTAGVPDSWRTALLRYMDKGAALLFEVVNHAAANGLIASAFTADDLYQAGATLGYGIRKKTLYRWIKDYRDQLFSNLHPKKQDNSLGAKIENNSSAGRKAETYQLLPLAQIRANILAAAIPRLIERHYGVDVAANIVKPLAELLREELASEEAAQTAAQAFEQAREKHLYSVMEWERAGARKKAKRDYEQLQQSLQRTHSIPLPADKQISGTKDYIEAFARAQMSHNSDKLRGKRQIAAVLGISETQVNKTLERAGIEIERNQFALHPVTATEVATLDRHVRQAGFTHRGYPKELRATLPDGTTRRAELLDCAFAREQLEQGAKVEVVIQIANKHRVGELPAPVPKPDRPPQPKRADPIEDAPAKPDYQHEHQQRYAGYSLEWLRGQIVLAFDALGWRTADGRFMNKQTGEIVLDDASLLELIEVYTGEILSTGDALLDAARRLGARVNWTVGHSERVGAAYTHADTRELPVNYLSARVND